MIGYNVVIVCDGMEVLELFFICMFDLVVFDVMMLKFDGYGVCQELCKEFDVFIVMLMVFGDVVDWIIGFEFGVDDYVVKFFSLKELEVCICCVLCWVEKEQVVGIFNFGVIQVSDLCIDINKCQVFCGDECICLMGMEFSLLELLVSCFGELFNCGEIFKEVWGYILECYVDIWVVDVYIFCLCFKLEDDFVNFELIFIVWGIGYLFQCIVDFVVFEGF